MKTQTRTSLTLALGAILAWAALAAAAPAAKAAETAKAGDKPLKVLFIGNSFTYYNNCPEMFKGLAAMHGKNVAVTAATNGGKDLVFQATAANVSQAIKADVYDVVVIQDKVGSDFRKERFLEGCAAIVAAARAHSPSAGLLFYEPWPTRAQLAAKTAYFTASYLEAARQHHARLAPAAEGFYALFVNDGLDYYCRDDRHPQPLATFNSAATIFYALFPDAPLMELDASRHQELDALINRCVAHAKEGVLPSYPLDALDKINRYAYHYAHAVVPAAQGTGDYVSVAAGAAKESGTPPAARPDAAPARP